jgi:hypothetical protein
VIRETVSPSDSIFGDVEGGIDVDAVGQQLADVLPASGVPLTGQVRMSELVHHGQLWATIENRQDVRLRKARALISDHAGGKHFEIGELSSGRRPPVTLPMGDDGVGARALPGACLPQHRVGLPYSGGNPEPDAQLAPAGRRLHRLMRRSW